VALAGLAVAVPALPAGAAEPTASAAAVREFEGTIRSVNSSNRTFRIHDTEAGTKRVKVVSSTRFERINGFSGLRAGMTNVETRVKRSGGRWVALDVEISGGGGSHGGGRGSDDG
jgi:uncharacterized membrane protein YgcG